MHVNFAMAGITLDGGWYISLIGMAVFASGVEMFAEKTEPGLGVVKPALRFPPGLFGVASLALVAQGLLMCIILLVTGEAGGGGLLLRTRDFVTPIALGGFVFSP